MVSPENIPVIVGVGEFIDRPSAPENALEPVALMAEAIQQANKDAGGDMLNRCASIEVVGLMSWRYQNPVGLLCDKLGVSPPRQINASFGGETPIRLIHEAALRVVEGDQGSSIIVGGEAMNSVNKAMKGGAKLNWTPLASKEDTVKVSGDRIERIRLAQHQFRLRRRAGCVQDHRPPAGVGHEGVPRFELRRVQRLQPRHPPARDQQPRPEPARRRGDLRIRQRCAKQRDGKAAKR